MNTHRLLADFIRTALLNEGDVGGILEAQVARGVPLREALAQYALSRSGGIAQVLHDHLSTEGLAWLREAQPALPCDGCVDPRCDCSVCHTPGGCTCGPTAWCAYCEDRVKVIRVADFRCGNCVTCGADIRCEACADELKATSGYGAP